ncbi:uncharacterized protein LOC114528350 [Dendronephthya gigantea]|uniref:uncharacterized protein LOC114528350 n=1 Tax=Dendronephthya gigantea TaxID=151771 RepID=UPI00106932F4|nr:uncharacterized protein LOC114528350 [Dendronephthya gigantea]
MTKTKVAPKKALSVARLELQAALLCARLATYVRKALTRPIHRLVFWTDSKCDLGWVRSTAVWYKPFVAHRIGEIQTLTDSKSWRHVPGQLNVSDYATRSRSDTKEEIIPRRWFTGPEFLSQSEDHWPKETLTEETHEPTEMKPSKVFVANSKKDLAKHPVSIILTRCSFLGKAQHIMAQVQRFVALCKGAKPVGVPLAVEEFRAAMVVLVRYCQQEAFSAERESLEKNKCVDRRSKLLSFTPYLDKDNVICVGGRLDRAKLVYEVRHPIILPQKHPLTELVVDCYHRLENHGGVDHVLAAIHNKFWIIHGRQVVKHFKQRC